MENTFDINAFDKERLQSPASFKQCRGLGYKFAKDQKTGAMNWRLQKQIQGCLYAVSYTHLTLPTKA